MEITKEMLTEVREFSKYSLVLTEKEFNLIVRLVGGPSLYAKKESAEDQKIRNAFFDDLCAFSEEVIK